MSKQDRHGVRTAADIERKYNFGKSFAEVYGLISDAQRAIEEANKELESLDSEEIFNRLTNNGTIQGIYREGDQIYINAEYIKSGTIATELIKADELKVQAANIQGTLTIGQLPSSVAQTNEIPKNISSLINDLGFQDVNGVTSIVGGIITTDYVEALGIKVAAANVTGVLAIGQLPETLAVKSEIPKNISALINDAGYQNVSGVTQIVGGVVTTDYVEALGIKVAAANITGTLAIGQLPGTVAVKSEIPTNISSLINDSGYVPLSNMTTIVGGIVTTDYVEALGIKVSAANVTGTLVVGQLPSTVAQKTDIPKNLSSLTNDMGYVESKNMTTIVGGIVTTDFVNALGITVNAAQVNGVLQVNQLPSTVAQTSQIPTTLSALTDDVGYVEASNMTTIVGGIVTTDYIEALGISVKAAQIDGLLTADQIDASELYVDAANIDGKLTADQIKLGGEMYIYDTLKASADLMGYFGYLEGNIYGSSFVGCGIISLYDTAVLVSEEDDVLIAAYDDIGLYTGNNGKVLIDSEYLIPNIDEHTYCGSYSYWWYEGWFKTLYVEGETIATSDVRQKENVNYDLTQYLEIFDQLKPCSYKYIKGERTHLGMIAQEVESAAANAGVSLEHFAAVCIGKENDMYGLRYGEFVPLLIAKVKQLEAEIKEMKANG